MLHVAVGKRRHVHQPVHSGEQLDEGAERLQARHLALQPHAFLELRARGIPRILLQCAQGEGDPLVPFLVLLDAQDLDAHLLPRLDHVLRVRDALVGQLGHVRQALQATQIHERAEVAHRADGALQDRADLELLAQLGGQRGALLLEQGPT